MTDWKKYLRKRVLLQDLWNSQFMPDKDIYEAEILAVSPQGRVKIMWTQSKSVCWYEAKDHVVLEVLE